MMKTTLNEESGAAIIQILQQINNNINYNINKCELSFNSFYAGGRFDALIPSSIHNYNDMLLYFKAIGSQITTYKKINTDVTDLRIFSFNDAIPWDNASIYSAGVITDEQWVEPLLSNKNTNQFYWTNTVDDTGEQSGLMDSLYCYTTVFSELDQKPQAILRMDVNKQNIFMAIDSVSLGNNGEVLLAKEDGSLIYSQVGNEANMENYKVIIDQVVQQGLDSGAFISKINGQSKFLVYSRNAKLGWLLIGSIPEAEYAAKTNVIRSYIILITVSSILFGFIATLLFSHLITRRITLLTNKIVRADRNGLSIDIDIPGNDEIGQLSLQFKELLSRINILVQEVEEHYQKENILINEKYELDMLKKEAELCALQTQINPHFLFNTLEMMKGLLYSDDPRGNITIAIQALSNTFKYNLAVDYWVKVKDEIQHIKNYLTIHNLRFDWQVNLINQLDDASMNATIVRFTFEPIIENAIIHGFRDSQKDNEIVISSEISDDTLYIFIRNLGNVIESSKLEEMKQLLAKGEYSFRNNRKGGLGIYNVNGRIKRYFGDQYGLDIESTEGIGTTVIIRVPNEIRTVTNVE